MLELPSILEILGRAGAIRQGKVGYNPSPVPDEEGHRGYLDLARLSSRRHSLVPDAEREPGSRVVRTSCR